MNRDGLLSYAVGSGRVEPDLKTIHLSLGDGDGTLYSNAQMDDYHADGVLRWRPPLEMKVRARFSADAATFDRSRLRGTAGFGFWNDPFGMTKRSTAKVGMQRRRVLRWGLPRFQLPQAVWFFFASTPSNMALAMDVPGFGWKAATIDAGTLLAKCLLPLVPFGVLACHVPWLYELVWPLAQRVLKIDEVMLPVPMDEWHEYRLVWDVDGARFYVDGTEVLHSRFAPRGPLGFVLWIDNQMMIATPQGQLQGGVLSNAPQWLEAEALEIRSL